jgi:TolB-like protein/Flp pilus assembly protein TadD
MSAITSSRASSILPLPDKPSIAVLAFQNMSGDVEQEYFADGIAEDIITALSKSRWLFVIARNSSFTYKGRAIDVKQIGRELGVRYVLEGSVRRVENRVRITGQLIEAATGAHLWAERFDRELSDIFAVQDEITHNVSIAIEPVMAQAERQRASRKAPDSLDAWEAYQRGLWHFMKQEPRENEQAKLFFQRGIDLDPNFAPGYYGLALSHLWDAWVWASRPLKDCLDAALPLVHRALALDDADPMPHFAAGCAFGLQGDGEGSRNEVQRVISLNPNHAWAVAMLGNLYGFNGQPEEGLAALNKAMRISPHDPLMWAWMGWISITHYFARNYQSALEATERVIRRWPDKPHAYRWKAASLGQLGRIREAKIALEKAIELSPANFQLYVRTRPPWIRPVDHALQLEGLSKAGLPDELSLQLPDKPSIAVLAFQNMSGDAEQEYFADGIAEDIITALSKSRWLFVIARNSSFTYKGRILDIKQIGRELGVRYILEGSVRKSGNRVRITAQLIEAVTGAHMWAEHYDRDLADIFAIQDEITGSVVTAIEPAMAQAEQHRVSRKLPDSLDAWETYHRGLWHLLKLEPNENDRARIFFQRAIDLDSGFAPGYYGLALTHSWDAAVYATRPLRESLTAAYPLAQRAVSLDDADSMAHFVLGQVFFHSGDFVGARNELDRAIAINPNNAWAMGASGSLFGNNGRLSEALEALGKAMRASPHDPQMWGWMLFATASNYFARDYQAALDAADRLIRFRLDRSQGYRWKAAALGQLGRIDEAKIALEQAIALSSSNFYLYVQACPPWWRTEDHALMVEGLRKAGLQE